MSLSTLTLSASAIQLMYGCVGWSQNSDSGSAT